MRIIKEDFYNRRAEYLSQFDYWLWCYRITDILYISLSRYVEDSHLKLTLRFTLFYIFNLHEVNIIITHCESIYNLNNINQIQIHFIVKLNFIIFVLFINKFCLCKVKVLSGSILICVSYSVRNCSQSSCNVISLRDIQFLYEIFIVIEKWKYDSDGWYYNLE